MLTMKNRRCSGLDNFQLKLTEQLALLRIGDYAVKLIIINSDHVNPANSRPTYRPINDTLPDFSSFFHRPTKKYIHCNNSVIIFFPSADSFWVLAIAIGR